MIAARVFCRNQATWTRGVRLGWLALLACCAICVRAHGDDSLESPGDYQPPAPYRLSEATDFEQHPVVVLAQPLQLSGYDASQMVEAEQFYLETSTLRQASMIQQIPLDLPRNPVTAIPRPIDGQSLSSRLFGNTGVRRSLLGQSVVRPVSFNADVVLGSEAGPNVTTDLGSLIRKSKSALSTEVQGRTPVVHDPRVRSSRVGSLGASGSYWVPARADLDTAVSKIDSRLVDRVLIIPGPYSSKYGPGFQTIQFDLLETPRYSGGNQTHGQTSFDHQSNGNQWLGLQSLWAGGEDWGVRGAYVHRTGGNYRAGDGTSVAADYESRAVSLAYGRDLSDSNSLEFSLLRLDQTDIEFPGFVFDITTLVTDGYEISYLSDDPWLGEQSETDVWYNRTHFYGDSRNAEKVRQFPLLAALNFDGTTDADVMSTGYRRAFAWGGDSQSYLFTLGHDLRMIKQEINEDFQLVQNAIPVTGTSPLPRSFSVNPGLFASYEESFLDHYAFEAGVRVDYVQTDVTEDANQITDVGVTQTNLDISYFESIGTETLQTDRWLWSLFGKLQREFSDALTGSFSLGYAERAPTLTELYGVQQLLLVVQNGLNVTTGDPRLKKEKLLQLDLALDFDREDFRGGVRAFSGWGFDYITFELMDVRTSGAGINQVVEQTSLRYVNTRLATLVGLESYLEYKPESWATPFATLRMVDGRDRTRNGDFATLPATFLSPSVRTPGLPRGFHAGPQFRTTADSESLPGISPAEARLGIRLKDRGVNPRSYIELSARIVDNQDRVASSLLELATPGFTTWDLRSVWQSQRFAGLTVFAGVENFTDKAFREHLDFQSRSGVNVLQPGSNFYVGTDWVY